MVDVHVIKLIHVSCAGISITGFFIRGLLRLANSQILSQRWIRIAPHIIDALLLISAIMLVYSLQLNIMEQPWIIAKITALLLYIFLGLITLRFAQRTSTQLIAFLGALLVFVYIIGVAMTHQVIPLPGI